VKIRLVSPKKKTIKGEKEFWSASFISFASGKKKYPCAFLALPTLASLVPFDMDVEIIDENLQEINFDEKVDLVGISFITCLAPRAYEIADEFRKRGITVVLGGIHTSMMPEEAKMHADSIVIGEAEDVFPKLINDFKNGNLLKEYKSNEKPSLMNRPTPRWDILKNESYTYSLFQTTRGCPFDCEFCTVKSMFGTSFRAKPMQDCIRDMEFLMGIEKKQVFIIDDNFTGNKERVKELLKNLIPFKISYRTQLSLEITKDEELLNLLALSGCRRIVIGLESLSQENLKRMNKSRFYQVNEYKEKIEMIQSKGIEVQGSLIFGYDFDTEDIFKQTVDFINESNMAYPTFNILTPFPGTRIFQRLKEENRILNTDWSYYDTCNAVFQPKNMSPETLQKGFNWARKQVFSHESIFKRLYGLWDLWNKNKVRYEDRMSPMTANLGSNYAVSD
jgi:radical SAM superfamily enzyme YgiQ (UPF0313 family)